ncbi:hypothetical protein EV121DRAFT_263536 [Schizophyllum commune]
MKRGAERQATRDDADNDGDDNEPGQGLKKADEATLAGRKIRGLPKRSRSSTPAATTDAPSSAPKFAGFSGFGGFGSTPSTSSSTTTSPAGSFSFGAPSVSSSASNATKTFAGLLGATSAPPAPPKPAAPPAAPSPTPTTASKPSAALTYYTALRGLNVSFVSAITHAVEEDPFADIAALAEHYKTLRISVQKQYENGKEKENTPAAAPAKADPPKVSMPAPPAAFAGFPKPAATSTPPASSGGGGFTFKPTETASSKPSPFSFPVPPPVTAASNLPFSLTKPDAPTPSSEEPPKLSSGFSFSKPAETSKPAESSNGSPFSSDAAKKDAPANPFSFAKTDTVKDNKDAAPPSFSFAKTDSGSSGFSFGSGSKPSFSFGSAPDRAASTSSLFGASPTPTPPPATPPAKPSAFGAFGFKPPSAGSLGNPVGFGFGSPPRTPGEGEPEKKEGETKPASGFSFGGGSSSGSGFSFGSGSSFGTGSAFGSKPAEKKEEQEEPEKPAEGGEKAADGDANNFGLLSTNPHDEEGIGEEEEVTTHVMRAAAFKLDDGKWTKLGSGMVRLKKHKKSEVRRMLMRNSSTGKININFKLYGGLNPKANNKLAVSFVGHDQGDSKTYNLKFKSEGEAQEMLAALNREIEFVKAKAEGA